MEMETMKHMVRILIVHYIDLEVNASSMESAQHLALGRSEHLPESEWESYKVVFCLRDEESGDKPEPKITFLKRHEWPEKEAGELKRYRIRVEVDRWLDIGIVAADRRDAIRIASEMDLGAFAPFSEWANYKCAGSLEVGSRGRGT